MAFNYLYTLLAYAILYLLTTISVLLSLLFNALGWKKALHAIILSWATGSFFIVGKRLHIIGREKFDKGKRYILMANHSSLFDIMGIMSVFPGVAWFGKEYLVKIPVFGSLLKGINYVPMKTTDLRNTRQMVDDLIKNTADHTVAIFPEGTRTITGELSKFRKGFLHVLKASELDILPVTLVGFYEFKPKNRFHFRYRVRLSVQIHDSLPYSELKELNDHEIIHRVQSRIGSVLPSYKTA